jgi:hypothetical protein
MEYLIREIREEVDVMYLQKDEYDSLNKIYFDIMNKRNPKLIEKGFIGNVKKCILSDGLSRVEVMVLLQNDTQTKEQRQDTLQESGHPTDNTDSFVVNAMNPSSNKTN